MSMSQPDGEAQDFHTPTAVTPGRARGLERWPVTVRLRTRCV